MLNIFQKLYFRKCFSKTRFCFFLNSFIFGKINNQMFTIARHMRTREEQNSSWGLVQSQLSTRFIRLGDQADRRRQQWAAAARSNPRMLYNNSHCVREAPHRNLTRRARGSNGRRQRMPQEKICLRENRNIMPVLVFCRIAEFLLCPIIELCAYNLTFSLFNLIMKIYLM